MATLPTMAAMAVGETRGPLPLPRPDSVPVSVSVLLSVDLDLPLEVDLPLPPVPAPAPDFPAVLPGRRMVPGFRPSPLIKEGEGEGVLEVVVVAEVEVGRLRTMLGEAPSVAARPLPTRGDAGLVDLGRVLG